MGRVKDYFWDEIEAERENEYLEPDFESYYENLEKQNATTDQGRNQETANDVGVSHSPRGGEVHATDSDSGCNTSDT